MLESGNHVGRRVLRQPSCGVGCKSWVEAVMLERVDQLRWTESLGEYPKHAL
jgi:hypothetical protein